MKRQTRAWSASLLLFACATGPLPALGGEAKGCHLKSPAAIGCLSADTAALVYERLGSDPRATSKSNIRAQLSRAQCMVAGDGYRSVALLEFRTGRVPTENGWVDVKFMDVDQGRYGLYYASRYIEGDCEPFKPKNCTAETVNGHTELAC